jgi:hypothetical protein
MSGRNRKQNVISTINSVRRNIELIDHISSQNANKLNSRFKKINDELEKIYENQSKSKKKSLSDPIPEEDSIPDPIPESPIRRNSSSLEDDLFNRAGERAKSIRRSRGRQGSHKGGSKIKRSRKRSRKK